MGQKRLCVLGEVNRRFIASPNVGALLEQLEEHDKKQTSEILGEGLIKMDNS